MTEVLAIVFQNFDFICRPGRAAAAEVGSGEHACSSSSTQVYCFDGKSKDDRT